MAENKPNVIVVSNTTGAGRGGGDKDPILKMPKVKADIGTILTLGGLIVVIGGGYYIVTQMPTLMNSLFPPQTAISSAPVSGAGVAPSIQTTLPSPIYPGTGAGSFPAPAVTNPGQAYPGVNQQLPLQYPQMVPNTGMPAVATPGVQTSYHAVIGEDKYMDHRGKRRKFIGERNIKEIIGSTEKDDYEVFDLIYGE